MSRATDSTGMLREGFARSALTVSDLWVAATGVGGALLRRDVLDITTGDRPATREEHDVLAAALNDHLVGRNDGDPVAGWDALAG